MNITEFKNVLIEEGIASANKHEKRPYRLRGAIDGFNLCRELETMDDFKYVLDRRREHEADLRQPRVLGNSPEEYWEYRIATVQVEYIYERLLVIWAQQGLYDGPLSAQAVVRAATILERNIQ